MSIHLLRKDDGSRWDRYVVESDASNYHRVGWKNVIERGFGHKAYYLMSEDKSGAINGILPLAHLKSVLFGNFMISLPYFNYGGICADNEEVGNQLLEEAVHIAKREHVEHIELRHTSLINSRLPVKTAKVSMRLEMRGDVKGLWGSFTSKLRSQIRRPIKEGMYTQFGREDELDSFYRAFSLNMRDLGTPVYSKEFFRNILREFPDTTRICTVYTRSGQPAASGFLAGFKTMLEIPWASSLKAYNRHSPNMLLYWASLKFACESGYRTFDFGRSTPGEGTCKFKEQWGARPVQLYWHYWLRSKGMLPELNPKNPKYRMAIVIWRKLPVRLTKLIGPFIVKNLP
ncbi:MAG: FemAB family PEP-CTERM system-associated protein [Nitrospirae bacterium]|nr:FemAB family PEP-CTERM system-associated protein [Nitrospirota bacterium]MCL5237685.1 FemAB family PEP-CTERM system-associated protein [Nitrospirota bacterium]